MGQERIVTRRAAVGGALALGATAVTLGCLGGARAPAYAQEKVNASFSAGGASRQTQYGFLLNVKNCVDCGECEEACRLWSRTPASVEARRTVRTYQIAGKEVHISTSCMHCAVPACASVCPAGAISKGDGGVVTVDGKRCIGCKYCYQACPYGVPHYTSSGMDKCDCCLSSGVPLGEIPHCVRACKVDALSYGPLGDLAAQVKGRAQRVDGSTGPSYLLLRS